MKKIIFSRIQGVVLAIGIGSLAVSGCKGTAKVGSPVYDPNSCTLGGSMITGTLATQCCSGGSPKSPLPEGCPQPPGFVGTTSAMRAFTDIKEAGDRALTSADSLVGKSQSNGPTGQMAATAALSNPQSLKPESKSAALVKDGLNSSSLASDSFRSAGNSSGSASGGGAAAGGAGGGASSILGFGAGITTQPAAEAKGGALSASAGGSEGMGSYSGGGGLGARSHGGEYGFGDLSAGGGQGGPDSLSFKDGRELASSGSVDPTNYFSMLKPTDSLFKVIERRYTHKAKGWAISDTYNAAAAVKKLIK